MPLMTTSGGRGATPVDVVTGQGAGAAAGATGPGEAGAEAVWTVAAVARRMGVSPSTLRSWSLRYGVGPVGHQPGRYRRYTEADVAELDTLRELVDQGMALPAAAELARQHRSRGSPLPPAGRPHPGATGTSPPGATEHVDGPRARRAARTLAGAARRLDLDAAISAVSADLAEYGVVATWDRACRPALVELDRQVNADGSCLDAILLLSWATTTALCRHSDRHPSPRPPAAAPVLLAAAPTEQHTLALEALLAALVERGLPTRMLGPSVPVAALRDAAATLRPCAIVVWSQTSETATPSALDAALSHTETVIAAGPGWNPRTLPPEVTRPGRLVDTVDLLAATSGDGPADRSSAGRSTEG